MILKFLKLGFKKRVLKPKQFFNILGTESLMVINNKQHHLEIQKVYFYFKKNEQFNEIGNIYIYQTMFKIYILIPMIYSK